MKSAAKPPDEQTRIDEIQQSQLEMALSPDLSLVISKYETEGVESLTPAEFARARAWYNSRKLRMQGQYFQYQQGFLDRSVIDSTLDAIANTWYDLWSEFGLTGNFGLPEWEEEINARLVESER